MSTPLAAVIFDVDGTLYHQRPLRRAMAVRLLTALARRPVTGARTLRVLRAYRRAQETLRTSSVVDVAAAQIRVASEQTGVHGDIVAGYVRRWMEEEPLSVLPGCVYPGTVDLLRACRANGLRLAALSDYPADEKLRVMGMAGLFDVVLCAQAPDVNAFKPNPKGLLVALDRLGVTAGECVYVGDRVDVDAAAAEAAGMRCVILTQREIAPAPGSFVPVSDFRQLLALLVPQASTVNHSRGRL